MKILKGDTHIGALDYAGRPLEKPIKTCRRVKDPDPESAARRTRRDRERKLNHTLRRS